MIRYALVAKESASFGGDEYVVFKSYSAEVLVCLDFVEVKVFGTVAAGTPAVDEVWNEVDARLVGHHEVLQIGRASCRERV